MRTDGAEVAYRHRRTRAPTTGRTPLGAQQRRSVPRRPKRPSSWNISRTRRPHSAGARPLAYRAAQFLKAACAATSAFRVPGARRDLAPTVPARAADTPSSAPPPCRIALGRPGISATESIPPASARLTKGASSSASCSWVRCWWLPAARSRTLKIASPSLAQRECIVHRRGGPTEQPPDLRCRTAQRGGSARTGCAGNLRMAARLLSASPANRSTVALSPTIETLHPRLLEVRGSILYLIY